ncbi:MAG: hypothetical protein ACTSWN_08620 [Promethearchaeota archaeon]
MIENFKELEPPGPSKKDTWEILNEKDGILKAANYVKINQCPWCHSKLKKNFQPESLYFYCACGKFDLTIHMDIETKEVVLAFSSFTGSTGFVDPDVLEKLESVLIRKHYLYSSVLK